MEKRKVNTFLLKCLSIPASNHQSKKSTNMSQGPPAKKTARKTAKKLPTMVGVTTANGLLYRDGVEISCPEADELAKLQGELHAEGLVRKLEAIEAAKSDKFDEILSGSEVDFEADKAVDPNANELEEIAKIADRHAELGIEIKDQQEYLKTLTDELFQIEMATLPNIMERLGLTKFTTSKGLNIEIKQVITASLPAPGTIESATGDEKANLQLLLE
jgi:hypothetical protein